MCNLGAVEIITYAIAFFLGKVLFCFWFIFHLRIIDGTCNDQGFDLRSIVFLHLFFDEDDIYVRDSEVVFHVYFSIFSVKVFDVIIAYYMVCC